MRVLVEAEFRSDGSWQISGFTTARLDDALDRAALVQRLSQKGADVLTRNGNAGRPHVPEVRDWEQFRDLARAVFADEMNQLIRRNWPAPQAPTEAHVLISIRSLLLDPDASVVDRAVPHWLEIVPFGAAVAAGAAKLRDDAFAVDCSRTLISFAPGGERIEATLTSPSELLVECCEVFGAPVVAGARPIWKTSTTRVVRRHQSTAMPFAVLSAEAVRGLASVSGRPSQGELCIYVRGRSRPITTSLPPAELPAFGDVADLLLDLGSTTTKWALRVAGRETVEHDQDTLSLTQSWGVEIYRKADLISDATGDRWCEWVARTLPALRRWVGREHQAYLRHVHVSLPTTDHFDVKRLGAEIHRAATDAQVEDSAKDLLRAGRAEHLVANGRIVLVPEHELVAVHYLSVLRILQKAASAYSSRFSTHEERRRDQAQRQSAWRTQKAAVHAFQARNWWYRLWNDKPTGPNGAQPAVDAEIAEPAKWMDVLVTHPEQLDQVVLLDAGGLSLDVSVLEKHTLVPSLSHSDATCGGEAISARLDRGETGPRGTQRKAALGKYWTDSLRLGQGRLVLLADRSQRQYAEATRLLHEASLQPLFASLARRWQQAPYCTVLLTGGGSRNPHLAEYVVELARTAGLEITVVDAPVVQGLIQQAREFPQPLADLDSPPIVRFEEAQLWSERREHQPLARYDKFAVVGGMCAFEGGEAR